MNSHGKSIRFCKVNTNFINQYNFVYYLQYLSSFYSVYDVSKERDFTDSFYPLKGFFFLIPLVHTF